MYKTCSLVKHQLRVRTTGASLYEVLISSYTDMDFIFYLIVIHNLLLLHYLLHYKRIYLSKVLIKLTGKGHQHRYLL